MRLIVSSTESSISARSDGRDVQQEVEILLDRGQLSIDLGNSCELRL